MKIHYVFLVLCTIISSYSMSFAQDKKSITSEFLVSGNCSMCKKNIESALKGKTGITSSDWNVKSKLIHITYNPAIINETQIHQAISNAGYDTEVKEAPLKSYDSLMGCCQYKRTLHVAGSTK